MCGIHLSRTTPHHPAAIGLMCHADERWTAVLPLVLLGIRTAYKEDLQSSAAELVYGEPLQVPGELLVLAALKVEATWTSCDQPRQYAMHPRPHSSTRISGTRPTCSCGRTPERG